MSKENKNEKAKNDEKSNVKQNILITILILILVALIGISAYFMTNNKAKEDEKTLAYTDLIKEMSYGNIEKVEMKTGSTTVKVKVKNE